MKNFSLAFLLLVSCSPDPTPPVPKVAPEPPGEGQMMVPPARPERAAVDLIKFEAPKDWVKEEPANNMRKAQYKIPDKAKKAADAQLALFYFGPSNEQLEGNIQRWAVQMGADDAKPEKIEGKCKITLVDLKGTYTGDSQAGPQENSRLLAAVVETTDGPWYFKLVGPADTVGPWREEFLTMLKGAGGK